MHDAERGVSLSLLFHEFPDGRFGLGLLLLRAAIGMAVVIQGATELVGATDPGIGTWVAGLSDVLVGAFIAIGFLTPIVGALLGLAAIGWWTSLIPAPNPNLFPSRLLLGFLAVMAGAVALLGPGAFSIDARLFGLREIIIPRSRPNA